MNTKVCTKCKVEKEINQFHLASIKKNIFQSSCKKCRKEYDDLNKEKRNEKQKLKTSQYKLWHENNPISIKTKICSKCKIEKEAIDFHLSKSTKDGLNTYCKICRIQKSKQDYPKAILRANQYKIFHENNPIPIKTRICSECKIEKEVNQFNKNKRTKNNVTSKCIQCRKENRQKNNDVIKQSNKIYYQNNKQVLKQKTKQYRLNNKEYYKDYQKEYKSNNRESVNLMNNKRRKERMISDPLFKLSSIIRTTINGAVKRKSSSKKNIKTELILGCSIQEFKLHLESKFQPWMNWDNYGNPKDKIFDLNKTWDIDHIIPISSAKTEEEVIKLNHYSNLQPLCSFTNRNIKKDKINT